MKPANSVVYTCSSGTACVEGDTTGKAWGLYGLSTKSDAIHGVTTATNGNSAVAGISNGGSGSANGVYGRSANGTGVKGVSTGGGGDSDGVYGVDSITTGRGIYGQETGNGIGILAESADTTGAYEALAAEGDNAQTWIFVGANQATKGNCAIDPSANLSCTGSLIGSSIRGEQINTKGQRVLSYASEAASATIEDVGTARMAGGVARVALEPGFASTIDRSGAYHVFVTPLSDTRGLYVSLKTPAGFEVRETQGGRANLSFDYRIVAHPLNAANDRLPAMPAARNAPVLPARARAHRAERRSPPRADFEHVLDVRSRLRKRRSARYDRMWPKGRRPPFG